MGTPRCNPTHSRRARFVDVARGLESLKTHLCRCRLAGSGAQRAARQRRRKHTRYTRGVGVRNSRKRAACKEEQWFEAIKKEHQGLDKRGVLKYETMPEACKNGHISAKKNPIDIRLLLSTKIKPDGTFDKLKARAVVSK